MKLANDPRVDYKDLVRIATTNVRELITRLDTIKNQPFWNLLPTSCHLIPKSLISVVGTGVPITKALAAQHKVVGVDFSESR